MISVEKKVRPLFTYTALFRFFKFKHLRFAVKNMLSSYRKLMDLLVARPNQNQLLSTYTNKGSLGRILIPQDNTLNRQIYHGHMNSCQQGTLGRILHRMRETLFIYASINHYLK